MSLEALGLSPDSTPEDVRRRYKQLAMKLHPDRGGTSEGFQQLKSWRDVALVQAEAPRPCAECSGAGYHLLGSGFSSIKMPCGMCGGSGVMHK